MYDAKKRVHQLASEFHKYRIGVLGDIIYDHYIWGTASRISPEAPVPIVRVNKRTGSLGGAANVLRNVAGLGAQAMAFGVVGHDAHGDNVLKMCQEANIDTQGLIFDPRRKTTVKTRVIANHQQVVRIDDEVDHPIDEEVRKRLLNAITNAVFENRLDGLIVEDYNKGVVTNDLVRDVNTILAGRNVSLALDPHPGNLLDLKGLSVLTPNRMEAFGLAGAYYTPTVLPIHDDVKLGEVALKLLKRWPSTLLLITLGADGMALFHEGDDEPVHIPTVAKEVYDVSGAGDTVIAAFMVAYLAGASAYEAAVIANHAAGIVVGKVGTVPIEIKELIASFESHHEQSGIS